MSLSEQVKELEEQLELEVSWAEGEIEFWQHQCWTAENEVEELRALLAQKDKPWWRYIIS